MAESETNLTHEQKTFIVVNLARYKRPSEVVALVKDEFDGLTISRQLVRHYNPEQSADVGVEWKELFAAERKKFLESPEHIGIYHSAYRVSELQTLYDEARDRRSPKFAAQLLEQAARESGGSFTNKVKQEHTGADGAPLLIVTPTDVDYRDAAKNLAPKESNES